MNFHVCLFVALVRVINIEDTFFFFSLKTRSVQPGDFNACINKIILILNCFQDGLACKPLVNHLRGKELYKYTCNIMYRFMLAIMLKKV